MVEQVIYYNFSRSYAVFKEKPIIFNQKTW